MMIKNKKNVWMIERKKGKIIYKKNDNLEILPQYFHNKF